MIHIADIRAAYAGKVEAFEAITWVYTAAEGGPEPTGSARICRYLICTCRTSMGWTWWHRCAERSTCRWT